MPVDISVRGLVETQRALTKIAENLHGRPMLDGMRSATLLVERDAKRNAPVDVGDLRRSITSEVRVEGLGGQTVKGVVGSNKVHAAAMEVGTRPHWPPPGVLDAWARRHGVNPYLVARAISRRGTRPRRYLQRAFEDNKPRIVRILGDTVGEIVKG